MLCTTRGIRKKQELLAALAKRTVKAVALAAATAVTLVCCGCSENGIGGALWELKMKNAGGQGAGGGGGSDIAYTITFNVNGAGGTVSPASMTTGGDGKLSSLPMPERNGYTFDGWFTSASGGSSVSTSYVFSGNTMIYAHWTVNSTPGGEGNNCTSAGNCKTVTIGGVTWLKENLNIETANSWCYGNKPDSCAKYGRLYTYDAAKSACELLGSGWHLPSSAEWGALVSAVGSPSGTKLKSASGWYSGGNGTDAYGFSALPGGYRNPGGDFGKAGNDGYWWTATEDGSSNAYGRNMDYNIENVREDYDDKGYGFSVRCVLGGVTPGGYTITFNVNGAGGTVSPASGTTGADGRLSSLPVPVRSGYTFNGWYTSASGGSSVSTSYVFSGSTMIYAHWSVESTPGGEGNNCTSAGTCKTVSIGGHVWLKENLNIQTADSWCYGEDGPVWDVEREEYVTISSSEADANCAKYGRLYTYGAAVSACELLGGGWHLPSSAEWGALVSAVGSPAGRKLKSETGWNYWSDDYYGTDEFGFSALPGGRRYTDGSFNHAGNRGYWWTATEDGSSYAYYRRMGYSYDYVYETLTTRATACLFVVVGTEAGWRQAKPTAILPLLDLYGI